MRFFPKIDAADVRAQPGEARRVQPRAASEIDDPAARTQGEMPFHPCDGFVDEVRAPGRDVDVAIEMKTEHVPGRVVVRPEFLRGVCREQAGSSGDGFENRKGGMCFHEAEW